MLRLPNSVALFVAPALALAASCSFTTDLDPLQAGSTSTGTGGEGGGQATTTSSTTSSAGGEGGGGGAPIDPCALTEGLLVDCGLVVRYYLDEAASGTGPRAALDAAPNPLDLPLDYTDGVTYTELLGQRGLDFPTPAGNGGAARAVAGTKVAAFQGATTGTIEAVLDYDQVTHFGSRILHLGHDTGAAFSLASAFLWEMGDPEIAPPEEVQIRAILNGTPIYANFDLALFELGRVVLHGVLDTTAEVAADRTRLYVNGVRVPLTSFEDDIEPPLRGAVTIGVEDSVALANRAIGGRNPEGSLFYGAYYLEAFDEAQIAHNATILLADDDTPTP